MTKFRFSNINHIHAYSLTLMMEAADTSETLVLFTKLYYLI
jgi:hypothetical protein